MNPCFDNYIGVRGVCNPDPSPPYSGKYIQDLEGISTPFLAQITDSDDVTFKRMVADAIDDGIEYGVIYFKDGLNANEKITIRKVLTHYNIGEYNLGTNPVAPAPVYTAPNGMQRGINIKRVGSAAYKLSKIFINNISILTNFTGAANLKIIDTQLATAPTLIPITLVAGVQLNTQVEYTSVGNEVFVLFDSVTASVVDSRISETAFTQASNGSNCGTCGGGASVPSRQVQQPNNNYLNILGYDGQWYNTTYTYGMKVNADLICSDDELFCQAKTVLGSTFANFILYNVGIKLIEGAMLNSDRFNFITVDTEQLIEQRNHYLQKAMDLRKRLINDFKGTLATIDRQCVICEGLTLTNGL